MRRRAESVARAKWTPGHRKVTSIKQIVCTYPGQTIDTSLGEPGDPKILSSRQPVTARASAAANSRYASYTKDVLQHTEVFALCSVMKTGI